MTTSEILSLRVWPERDGKYLPLDPYEAYANGAAKDIDILQGCNKDELGYFIYGFGLEAYTRWAADRKAKKLAQLTDEERTLVESFCNDAKDVSPKSSLPLMRCGHALELASVLNHPENTIYTGRTFDETFSKTMRKMWVQFAKTGNPSLSAEISPDGKAHTWPLYDSENKSIMVFHEFNIHPEKESERKILDWERTYFLTKYFCI